MRSLILIIALLHLTPLFGAAFNCPTQVVESVNPAEKVQALYKWAFSQSYYYTYGFCPHNVWRFVNLLESCDVDISSAQVLFISTDDNESNLILENDRAMMLPPTKWSYHVVLAMQNSIYDSSFGSQAEIPSTREYFSRQFNSLQSNGWRTLTVRAAQAKKYGDLFNPGFNGRYTYADWMNPEPGQDIVTFYTGQSWLQFMGL